MQNRSELRHVHVLAGDESVEHWIGPGPGLAVGSILRIRLLQFRLLCCGHKTV